MKRRNPFDDLFRLGRRAQPWTEEMIDEFMEPFESGLFDPSDQVPEGKRVEVVDGERREYELNEDGEWERIDNDGLFDVTETENGYSWTVDMSRILPNGSFEASASMNNGVLTVSFVEKSDE